MHVFITIKSLGPWYGRITVHNSYLWPTKLNVTAARSQSLGAVFARGLPIKFLWCHLEEFVISKNIHRLGQCDLIAMKDNSMIAFLFIICFFLRDEFYCFTTQVMRLFARPFMNSILIAAVGAETWELWQLCFDWRAFPLWATSWKLSN